MTGTPDLLSPAPAPTDPAPAPSPAPAPTEPWYSTIQNPEVKALMTTQNYASPEKAAEGYYNLRQLQSGSKSVVGIPKDDADVEGWNKLYSAQGRPETPDKYEFTFDKEIQVHPKMEAFAKSLFHELGASPGRAQKGADKWNAFAKEMAAEEAATAKAANEAAVTELKTKWGDKWDANVASGQQVVRALGIEDAVLSGLDSAMGMASVMKLMAAIGQKLGTETPIINNGAQSNSFVGMTKEMATTEIGRLRGDADFQKKMTTNGHPERDALVKRWEELHRLAG